MYSQVYCSTLILLAVLQVVQGWEVCDVTEPRFGAVGDGLAHDGAAIAAALAACDEVILPANATFLSGPLNITSNQVMSKPSVPSQTTTGPQRARHSVGFHQCSRLPTCGPYSGIWLGQR